MSLQKQQLKHEHRDRMVQVGIKAVAHVLKPSDGLARYLEMVRGQNVSEITQVIKQLSHLRKHPVNTDTREFALLCAVYNLFRLSLSEQYINGRTLESSIFVPAAYSIFESEKRQREIEWQDQELRPLIAESFNQLRIAEKKLKAA